MDLYLLLLEHDASGLVIEPIGIYEYAYRHFMERDIDEYYLLPDERLAVYELELNRPGTLRFREAFYYTEPPSDDEGNSPSGTIP